MRRATSSSVAGRIVAALLGGVWCWVALLKMSMLLLILLLMSGGGVRARVRTALGVRLVGDGMSSFLPASTRASTAVTVCGLLLCMLAGKGAT